jgi:hypothetical protein
MWAGSHKMGIIVQHFKAIWFLNFVMFQERELKRQQAVLIKEQVSTLF